VNVGRQSFRSLLKLSIKRQSKRVTDSNLEQFNFNLFVFFDFKATLSIEPDNILSPHLNLLGHLHTSSFFDTFSARPAHLSLVTELLRSNRTLRIEPLNQLLLLVQSTWIFLSRLSQLALVAQKNTLKQSTIPRTRFPRLTTTFGSLLIPHNHH
jgi:hypothetical protein